jgi:hypothetical protein
MNRAAVLVLLSIALVGCADQNTLTQFNCVIDPNIGPCKIEGTKANPTPKLIKTGNGLQMTPKALCTQPSADVTVTIKPPNSSPAGTVIIAAKDLQNAVWLLGTNSDAANPDEIRISIPEEVKQKQYHYVVVDTVTGDCLDPRWDVQ